MQISLKRQNNSLKSVSVEHGVGHSKRLCKEVEYSESIATVTSKTVVLANDHADIVKAEDNQLDESINRGKDDKKCWKSILKKRYEQTQTDLRK